MGLEDPAGLQRRLHGNDVESRNIEESLAVIRSIENIPEHNSLRYYYKINTTDEFTDTVGDMLASGMYVLDTNDLWDHSVESVDV